MLNEIFEQQVNRNPHKVAIKFRNINMTYHVLNILANRTSYAICETLRDSDEAERIGLFFDPGPNMIASVLGVLKSGDTYVPMTSSNPEPRLSYIVSDADLSMIICDSKNMASAKRLAEKKNIPVLNMDMLDDNLPDQNPERHVEDHQPAYILYTSGSTGFPKGVIQTQLNIFYFINQYTHDLSITGDDQLTLISSFGHDAAVMDIYGALLNGATLNILDLLGTREGLNLPEWLKKEKITIWHSVPTVYRYLVDLINDNYDFPNLRYIVLGGEAVNQKDIDALSTCFPATTLYNLYGQTESTYNSGKFYLPGETCDRKISIGKGLDEVALFVVDDDNQEVDPLVVGEIVVCSPYVSPGYWNGETADNAVFGSDPEFGRIYWTGDLGRRGLDGNIEYFGRKDFQIKIRGYRVNPVEIENRLLELADISKAVVVAGQDKQENAYLSAYIVSSREYQTPDLRRHVGAGLPDYMIPDYFIRIEKLPVNQNGKIDRKALPKPDTENRSKAEYEAPTNQVEVALAEIWKEILDIPSVGVNDNFFDIGGNSLKLLKVYSSVNQIYPSKVAVVDLFSHVTISELARFIEQGESHMVKRKLPVILLPDHFISKSSSGNPSRAEVVITADGVSIDQLVAEENQKKQNPASLIDKEDVYLSVFIYLLGEITGLKNVSVQMPSPIGELLSLNADFESLHDFSEFFTYIHELKTACSDSDVYTLDSIDTIRSADSPAGVIPFFSAGRTLRDIEALSAVFDPMVQVWDDHRGMTVSCIYNSDRLVKNQMNDVLSEYLRFLKILVTGE